jgi:peptidoglycan/LPS O-acetylase OafA/YrhL
VTPRTTLRLPGLDVLRALAVAAVVAFHSPLPGARGGFLGVDIFFVISGFLITKLLIDEYELSTDGKRSISIRGFWGRRARRLLPASVGLLVVTVVLLITVDRGSARSQRGDVVAALAYVSNWYQLLVHRNYFEGFGRPPLLRHLWSLAIEEQFYVVWPLLMSVLLRWRRKLTSVLLLAAGASAVAMFALYARWSGSATFDVSSVYLRTDTRIQAMLVGAAAAVWFWPVLSGQRESPRWSRVVGERVSVGDLFGLGGLVAMLTILLTARDTSVWMFRGGFFALAVSTSLLIGSFTHPHARIWPAISRARIGTRLRPLQWIGQRSYGIYLWHWPIFVHTRPGIDVAGPAWLIHVGRIAATLVVAEFSWRLIEQPLRRFTWKGFKTSIGNSRLLATASAGVATVCVLTLLLVRAPVVKSDLERQLEENARLLASGKANDTSVSTEPLTTTTIPSLSSSASATPTDTAATSTTLVGDSVVPSSTPDTGDPETTLATPESSAVVNTSTTSTTLPWELQKHAGLDLSGLAVGDSVMLGGARGLIAAVGPGVTIDALQSRAFINGIDVVRRAHQNGTIGDVLVIHLGSNGPVTATQLKSFLKELADVPLIVLVNLRVPGFRFVSGWNAMLNTVAATFSNVAVADWATTADRYPQFLYRDGTHIRPDVARVYGNVISGAILRKCGIPTVNDPAVPGTTRPKTTTTTTTSTLPPKTVAGATTLPPGLPELCASIAAQQQG